MWCLGAAGGNHAEHIVPENLQCPPELVLDSSWICKRCNNGLGHLDQAVSDDFDFLTFMRGTPRKRGRPPAIKSRGNVIGTFEDGAPSLSFNVGRQATKAHDGSHLTAYHGRGRNIRADLDLEKGELKFSVPVGGGPKFVRGVHKIALSALAYFHGKLVYDSAFDPIRSFVQKGHGSRHVIVNGEGDGAERHVFNKPLSNEQGEYCVTFRILVLRFLVDLSPDERNYPQMLEQTRVHLGDQGWTYLPPNG